MLLRIYLSPFNIITVFCLLSPILFFINYYIVILLHSGKRFDWIKENYLFERLSSNLFELNKICLNQTKYLNQIKICSNKINFCFKPNKLYIWPYINALISMLWKILFYLNKCLFGSKILCFIPTNFIQFK